MAGIEGKTMTAEWYIQAVNWATALTDLIIAARTNKTMPENHPELDLAMETFRARQAVLARDFDEELMAELESGEEAE